MVSLGLKSSSCRALTSVIKRCFFSDSNFPSPTTAMITAYLGRIKNNVLKLLLYIIFLVLICCIGIVVNPTLLALCLQIGSPPLPRPQNDGIEAVSGLYGPGAYIAWTLCTISAIISSATHNHPSTMFSPDQIVSFLYSAFSTYWYYCRVFWYETKSLDFMQNYPVQAGAFVFNVSTLFYGFGITFSVRKKRSPWFYFLIWEYWLGAHSPPARTGGLRLIPIHLFSFILTMPIGFFVQLPEPHPRVLIPLFLLEFALLEAIRCQLSTKWILVIPRAASSITDLDQLVSLITAIVLVAYQWELWNLPTIAHKLHTRLRQDPTSGNSIRLENSTSVP
jgi:hypothetical protein